MQPPVMDHALSHTLALFLRRRIVYHSPEYLPRIRERAIHIRHGEESRMVILQLRSLLPSVVSEISS